MVKVLANIHNALTFITYSKMVAMFWMHISALAYIHVQVSKSCIVRCWNMAPTSTPSFKSQISNSCWTLLFSYLFSCLLFCFLVLFVFCLLASCFVLFNYCLAFFLFVDKLFVTSVNFLLSLHYLCHVICRYDCCNFSISKNVLFFNELNYFFIHFFGSKFKSLQCHVLKTCWQSF